MRCSNAAMIPRSGLAISVLNHELGGDQSNCRSKWVSERQCRHSTDALMRESEFWTPRSDSLSMHLNPRFSPSGHAREFIRLACARARPAAHGRGGFRMRKFGLIYGVHETGTHLEECFSSMSTAVPTRTRQRLFPLPVRTAKNPNHRLPEDNKPHRG